MFISGKTNPSLDFLAMNLQMCHHKVMEFSSYDCRLNSLFLGRLGPFERRL